MIASFKIHHSPAGLLEPRSLSSAIVHPLAARQVDQMNPSLFGLQRRSRELSTVSVSGVYSHMTHALHYCESDNGVRAGRVGVGVGGGHSAIAVSHLHHYVGGVCVRADRKLV